MNTEINSEIAIRHLPMSVRAIDTEKRTIDFAITNESIDRHNTVLDEKGWDTDAYMRNPVFGYQHEIYGSMFKKSDPDDVIGKGIKLRTENGEKILTVEFEPKEINEKADKLFKKVNFGSLGSVSVGFLPLPGEKGETKTVKLKSGKEIDVFHYGKRELLEVSLVNIPSNRDAQKRAYDAELERDILLIYNNGENVDNIEERPFPNEHAARVRNPDGFNPDTFRRTKNNRGVFPGAGLVSIPSTAAIIWGKLKGSDAPADQPLTQALRFPTKDWTEKQARDFIEENKIKTLLFEPATEKKQENEPVTKKRLSLQKKKLELAQIS